MNKKSISSELLSKRVTKRTRKGIVVSSLLILGIFLGIIILEVVLRFALTDYKETKKDWSWVNSGRTGFYSLDPDRIYKINSNRPTKRRYRSERELYGFRYNPKHLDNENNYDQVIVVVGDSFVYGHNVRFDETYPYILEMSLKESGIKAKVENAGVSGYGLDQVFIYLRDVIIPNLQPDIVVWSLNQNDFGDSYDACLFKETKDGYGQVSARWNSLFFKHAYYPLIPDIVKKMRIFSVLDSRIPERYTYGCTPDQRSSNWEDKKLAYFLRETKDMMSEYGGELLAMVVLNEHLFIVDNNQDYWEQKVDRIKEINDRFYSIATQEKIRVVDVNLAALTKESNSNVLGKSIGSKSELFQDEDGGFGPGWRHPSALGNELMGELMAHTLVAPL